MPKDQFVGTWKLISSELRLANGERTYPFGKNAVGTLTYHGHGHMSVHVMRPGRPGFASGDPRDATDEEIKAAFDGYVAYFGTYTVNDEERIITHHVIGSLFPNWIGQDQRRAFEFSGSRLTLSTPPIPFAKTTLTAVLVWEREG
jgi:hypothetical protein